MAQVKSIYDITLEDAPVDNLTRFYRREALDTFLDKVFNEAQINGTKFSVGLVDIDHFKKFNDKYGHLFGDEVLMYIASTLRLTLQESGYIFRYGGDEFVVVFPHKDAEEAYHLMRKCNHSVANRPFSYKGKLIIITISCGVAGYPRDTKVKDKIFKRADDALYFSKKFGRNATTLAGRMAYQKLGRLVARLGIVLIILAIALGILYIFRDRFQRVLSRFTRIEVITNDPEGIDTIILKRGSTIKGYIIKEDANKVEISLELDQGKGTLVFDRSEIAEIKRGNNK